MSWGDYFNQVVCKTVMDTYCAPDTQVSSDMHVVHEGDDDDYSEGSSQEGDYYECCDEIENGDDSIEERQIRH